MQNSYQNSDTSEWFTGTAQAPPPKKKLSLYVAILLLLLIIIAGAVVASVLVRPICLTADDYQNLTGVRYSGKLQPTTSFYAAPLDFTTNESSVLTAESKATLDSFANFYKTHQQKSMQFTIDAAYSSDDQKPLAAKRSMDVQRALTTAGVLSGQIITNQPTLIVAEEDAASSPQSFTVSITSVEGCR